MAGHHAFSHFIYIYIDIDWIPNIPNFCPQKKGTKEEDSVKLSMYGVQKNDEVQEHFPWNSKK